MNPLGRTRLIPVAAAIAAVALLPTPANATASTGKVALTHTQLIAALSNIRAATASAEGPGWRQVRVIAPGPGSATSWTTTTRHDGASGRLATSFLFVVPAAQGGTTRSHWLTITVPNAGVWVGTRVGAGNYMAASQPLLDLLGRPNARYKLSRTIWGLFLREGQRLALSQVVGGISRSNPTGTVVRNADGSSTYVISGRYSDENSRIREAATFVLHVAPSGRATGVDVQTTANSSDPARSRHITESFGAQAIARPRAAETVLDEQVALAAESLILAHRVVDIADRSAATVNRDAALARRNAAPADIRAIVKMEAVRDGLQIPVSVLAISGGARLSAVNPFTHKTVVAVIRSVRGRAVVS